jgi:hypothetical protein
VQTLPQVPQLASVVFATHWPPQQMPPSHAVLFWTGWLGGQVTCSPSQVAAISHGRSSPQTVPALAGLKRQLPSTQARSPWQVPSLGSGQSEAVQHRPSPMQTPLQQVPAPPSQLPPFWSGRHVPPPWSHTWQSGQHSSGHARSSGQQVLKPTQRVPAGQHPPSTEQTRLSRQQVAPEQTSPSPQHTVFAPLPHTWRLCGQQAPVKRH